MLSDRKVIVTCGVCVVFAMLFLGWALDAFYQIKTTGIFVMRPEYFDLFKWLMLTVGGVGAFGGYIGGVVGYRSHKEKKLLPKPQGDNNDGKH